jgi:hypothetical protein
VKRIFGHAWAFPVTIFGLIYAELFRALGWYFFDCWVGGARVYRVRTCAPIWLLKLWAGWGGHAIGDVIVVQPFVISETVEHELEHVRQCRTLGIFQPILYGLFWIAIKLGCPRSNPYRDNPFEREARRAAGQE